MPELHRESATSTQWSLLREQGPFLILTLTFVVTVVGLAGWLSWYVTADWQWIITFFHYPNSFFTLLFVGAEVGFCVYVREHFDARDALRSAWTWLSLAAFAHFAGRALAIGVETFSPGRWNAAHDLGVIVGGPIQMALLLVGLTKVAGHCRRLGILRKLTWADYLLLLLVGLLTVRTLHGISQFVANGGPITWFMALSWTSDPLLLMLLGVAILIRRSVASLGFGMIANCWRSFVAGIVLTSLGSATLWCLDCTLPAAWTMLGWYVWLVADAAYALAPAFQVAALERVRMRSRVVNAIALSH